MSHTWYNRSTMAKNKTVYVRDSRGDWYKDNKRLSDRPPLPVILLALTKQLKCKIVLKVR